MCFVAECVLPAALGSDSAAFFCMKYREDKIMIVLFFYAASAGFCMFFAIKGYLFLALVFAVAAGFNMTALQHFKV